MGINVTISEENLAYLNKRSELLGKCLKACEAVMQAESTPNPDVMEIGTKTFTRCCKAVAEAKSEQDTCPANEDCVHWDKGCFYEGACSIIKQKVISKPSPYTCVNTERLKAMSKRLTDVLGPAYEANDV